MAETSFPFDAGSGSSITEDHWSKMGRLWLPSGVIGGELLDLQVFGDSTGPQVKVRTGRGWVEGHFYESDAEKILPIAANASGNPRVDRAVLRLDKTANAVATAIVQGTPAASPVAPALTQTASIWEVPLAQVAVANGFATITAANVTEDRVFTGEKWIAYTPIWSGTGVALGNGVVTGRYHRQGKNIELYIKFTFGSSSNAGSGAWAFSLPPGVIGASGAGMTSQFQGDGWVSKAAGGIHSATCQLGAAATTILALCPATVGGAINYVAAAVPTGAWAANDVVHVGGTFEIA